MESKPNTPERAVSDLGHWSTVIAVAVTLVAIALKLLS
jgi:hypothetical protein